MTVTTLALVLGITCMPAESPAPLPLDSRGPSREALYTEGITFDVFLDQTRRRRQTWLDNHAEGGAPDDLVARAEAVPGTWRLLVVAIDSCSDSVGTMPYLAHLVSAVDGLDMRIVDPTAGRAVMEAHLTPDGRAATPTMVLLNEGYEEVGCFVERPSMLQEWALTALGELGSREFVRQKTEWYDEDRGRQTMEAIVALMERAAAGADGC